MTDAHIQDTIRQICNLKNTFTTRVVDRQVLGRLARELAKALKDEGDDNDR
jgi:hypothetical protein